MDEDSSEVTVTLKDVEAAREHVSEHIHRTRSLRSSSLSQEIGSRLWLKPENLQQTGSFKVRGAINAVGRLSPEELSRGVITVSAGNHGMALSYAARVVGTRATVVMPETAVRSKIAAVESYGGRSVLVDGNRLMESMEEIQSKEGQIFIHPFDNPRVIAGQGTVGLEILEEVPDVEAVVVPVGGGGLLSGIAVAVKSLKPEVRIIGVEPEGSTAVSQSLEAGGPIHLEHFATIADGLNAPWGGVNTLSIIQRLVDELVTVTDDDIIGGLSLILDRTKLLVEPAGAAAIAALVSDKISRPQDRTVVAVLSGGNVDLAKLLGFLPQA